MNFYLYVVGISASSDPQVKWLESFLGDRSKDIKESGKGFVECVTRNHKTAPQTARQAAPMPLIAPTNGLGGSIAWGPLWVQTAAECGLSFLSEEMQL